jgi:hypothetical protein
MLNLRIAMVRLIARVSIVLIYLFSPLVIDAQEKADTSDSNVIIISPEPGQPLQGTILIIGEINTEDSLKLEISFSYADNPRDTWFLIHEFDETIPQEINLEWDTNALTDGQYTLRMVLTSDEGEFVTTIPGLRVRNYSVIETSTPRPTATPAPADTRAPTVTLTMTITPIPLTATPLPPNPAQINSRDIGLSLGKGAAAAVGLFAFFGLYQFARNRRRSGDQ